MSDSAERIARSWNREYETGRYEDQPPVRFVNDILSAARAKGITTGRALYIGCGNGRNFLPLLDSGLDLTGVDVSSTAIDQLVRRAPHTAGRLVHGDISTLPVDARYDMVIGIQVFQHGDGGSARSHVRAAQARLKPGGLFCLRVNHVETDIVNEHRVIERFDDGSYTIRYNEGPKTGLSIHFFSRSEIRELFADFEPVLSLRRDSTPRDDGTQWSQWEAIWRRPVQKM